MDNTLKVIDEPRFHQDSFFIVRKRSPFYKINDLYTFIDQGNSIISSKYLVGVEEITFDKITPTLSYLDKNCNTTIYKQILEYYNCKKEDILTILVFSNQNPKSYD